jgi:hypothetical protein
MASNLSKCHPTPSRLVFHGGALITNARLAPSVIFDAQTAFPAFREGLRMVDGIHLKKAYHEIVNQPWPAEIQTPESPDFLLDDVDIESYREPIANGLQNIFIAFHNRSNEERPIQLRIQTDVHWHVVDGACWDRRLVDAGAFLSAAPVGVRPIALSPVTSQAVRLCAGSTMASLPGHGESAPNGIDRLVLLCASGRRVAKLFDEVPKGARISFSAPFVGEEHNAFRSELSHVIEEIDQNGGLATILFKGRAGVGKSRVISEALRSSCAGSRYPIVTHTFDSVGPDAIPRELRDGILNLFKSTEKPEWVGACTSLASLMRILFDVLGRQDETLTSGRTPVIVLEDLHNAGPALRKELRSAISTVTANRRIILILSGRTDEEVSNPDYRAFLADLSSITLPSANDKIRVHDIRPLSRSDAHIFVRSIVEGIDDTSVERIVNLSGEIPNIIIQYLEYLLDSYLINIVSSGLLSITDPVRFSIRLGELPDSVAQIYAGRFRLLAGISCGASVQDALLAAAFFGSHVPVEICNLADEDSRQTIEEELIARGFLRHPRVDALFGSTPSSPFLEWGHESIKLFFRNLARCHIQGLDEIATRSKRMDDIISRFDQAATRLYHTSSAFAKLDRLSSGAVAVLAGAELKAKDAFGPMMTLIRSLESFSTIDGIDTGYFEHIDYAVELLRRTAPSDDQLLARLLLTKAYIGAFHLSLRFAVEADRFGQHILLASKWGQGVKEWCSFWLNTVLAHVYMDAGDVGEALARLLMLETALQLHDSLSGDPRLIFETHNCLRLLYTYTNFGELAAIHGQLADRAAQDAGKQKGNERAATELIGMGLGDEALRFFLTDPARNRELNLRCQQENVARGSDRHQWHAMASVAASHLLLHLNDDPWLADTELETDNLINSVKAKQYYSIVPRLHLLHATLAYARGRVAATAGQTDRAHSFFDDGLNRADQGVEAAIVCEVGYILWQLRNLKAVILKRRGDDESAALELRTAMKNLESSSLTFMGDSGVVSAAPIVIANYLKAYVDPDAIMQSRMSAFHKIRSYDWGSDSGFAAVRSFAAQYHHVIQSTKVVPQGIILDEPTMLGVVCWF